MAYRVDCPFCTKVIESEFWEDVHDHAMKCRERYNLPDWRDRPPDRIITCEEATGAGGFPAC